MGSTLWSSIFYRMLWLLVVCVGLSLGQEVTDEVLDNINEPTGISLKDSFRCGLFFPTQRTTHLTNPPFPTSTCTFSTRPLTPNQNVSPGPQMCSATTTFAHKCGTRVARGWC